MTGVTSTQPLVDLGLTELEAEVYAYLIGNSPATGYGVAKGLGKPAANTYKALESLHEKGAVVVEDGRNRLWRALPVDEVLGGLEARFLNLKSKAAAELSSLTRAPDDERVYHLKTPDQVFEKFRRILKGAEEVALLDLFPLAVSELRQDIETVAARGVAVAIKIYEPCEIAGAEVVVDPSGRETLKRWPAVWANGVVDAREHLMALLSADGERVHQAIWSGSAYLSCVYHCGLAYEIAHAALVRRLGQGRTVPGSVDDLSVATRAHARNAPGFRIVRQRIGAGPTPAPSEFP
jgi:sugar-specific transcriptional regulator TrmB